MRSAAFVFSFAISALSLAPSMATANQFLIGGGLNLATFNLDFPSGLKGPEQNMKPGLSLRLGYQTEADNGASLVTLGYENKGSIWVEEDLSGSEKLTIHFDYLQLGYQYKWMGGQEGGTQVFFAPGLGLAILINSEGEYQGQTGDMNDVAAVDLELGFGLGLQVPAGNNAILFEIGYGYGLLDTDGESEDFSAHNSVVKFQAGFLFGL